MAAQRRINESLREIDSQTWLVGDKLLLSRSSTASSDYLWSDGCGSFYSISEAPAAIASTSHQALATTPSSSIQLVYNAGNASAVWKIGNAFLKVKASPPSQSSTTREHVTLARVKAMAPSFAVPNVLYHGEWAGRQYLVLSKVPGQTLAEAWPAMDEATKRHYVNRVADICNELGRIQADDIAGLDGNQLFEPLLIKDGAEEDFSNENLRKSCVEVGMDCSTFVFSHCDLGPGNLIVDHDGSLGIIDWEMAGFVPKAWIRTRFCISGGMDLPGTSDERFEWRRRMQRRLSAEGYLEFTDEWLAWYQEHSSL